MLSILKIRKKILQQAIRGELVPHDEQAENASFLYNRIQEEKQRLIKQKKIKKQKPLPPVEKDEMKYELPKDWIWTRLGDVIDFQNGYAFKSSDYVDDGIGLIKIGNIQSGQISETKMNYLPREIADSVGREFIVENGDLLIAMSGATTGKLGINNTNKKFLLNQRVGKIVPIMVDKYYIFYLLETMVEENLQKSEGSAIPNLSTTDIQNIVLPLPPLGEQKRIVEKVNELFEVGRKLKSEIKFQHKYIEKLRNRVVNDALQGLLVPQNEEEESSDILLEKIQAKKEELVKSKVIKKPKSLPPIEENEIPHELPFGWTWVRIGDIAQINPRNAIDDDSEVGFVPMTLIEDGYSGKHISETRKWSDVKKGFTHFQENDIAVAKITPCFENKKSAIMKDLSNGYGAGTTELHIVRPFHDYVLVDYLMCLFKSDKFIEKGVQTYTGTAGQQRISKDFIENYVIGLPPIEEQHRIVEKVNAVWETINEIENNIVKAK